jgi:hypothetical protein
LGAKIDAETESRVAALKIQLAESEVHCAHIALKKQLAMLIATNPEIPNNPFVFAPVKFWENQESNQILDSAHKAIADYYGGIEGSYFADWTDIQGSVGKLNDWAMHRHILAHFVGRFEKIIERHPRPLTPRFGNPNPPSGRFPQ